MGASETKTVIDLFCGCGGISSGLRAAGFSVLGGVDLEAKYLSSYRHNFPEALSLEADLAGEQPSAFMSSFGIQPGELDLLAGGPPCQGFSKNVPRSRRTLASENNLLVRTFLTYSEAIKPKAILMENVAEMKNGFDESYTSELLERLSAIGYQVTYGVLNSADFGIPQRRRRAFFICYADEIGKRPTLPVATHSAGADSPTLFSEPHVNVWDAIGDLPSVGNGGGEELTSYVSKPQNEFQKRVRGRKQKVRNHVARKLSSVQHARLAALEPGQGLRDLPPELRVKGGYSGAYGRLTKEMVAPTITRWVFHPGSGRWGHPVDTRVLTIREAARIQGFPDSFEFTGTYLQQAGQLGNAVPPMLAEVIGRQIAADIR